MGAPGKILALAGRDDPEPRSTAQLGPVAQLEPLDLPPPADVERYDQVDVSVEPANTNDDHSGESILRVPLARLRP